MTSTGSEPKRRVALMSYAMDNRPAKGTALYTRKLIEQLLEDQELDITLVHYGRVEDPLYARAHEILMPRVRLPYGSHFVSQMLWFWRHRHESFDVIHWFQPRLYPFFWKAPTKKIVVTFHGGGDVTSGDRFVFSRAVFNLIAKVWWRRIDAVIADSLYAKGEVAQAYGIEPERISAILIGVAGDFKPLNRQASSEAMTRVYGLPADYLLCVSRLQHHKNVLSLVRAYILGRDRNLFSEKLVIVGMPAGDEKEVYDAASASPYASDILFKDYVEGRDLNALYVAARAFVFPSLNEGFGLPLIEAMASGTPVVSSNATALSEVGGDAALFFDPLDLEAMARQMQVALAKGTIRESMIRKGLARAATFTWEGTARETVDVYHHLLDQDQ